MVIQIDWSAVWSDVAARLGAHRAAGRGHLLTEDTVRFATVLILEQCGLTPDRLASEVLAPELAGGKLDLVVDPPAGAVVELKYPRDSRTGFSPDTMTLGELLRDFLRVAAVPARDRWVVQVLNQRLVRYLVGVAARHPLSWPTAAGETLQLHPEVLAALPDTAVRAIGTAVLPDTVTAVCKVAEPVDDALTLFAFRVVPGATAAAPEAPASAAGEVGDESLAAAPATRHGARREILAAARRVMAPGRDTFTVTEVIDDMHAHGTGVAGYTDVERVDRGTYRLR